MTDEDIQIKIAQWFELAEGAGVILPDGWFGRPNDSFFQLTCIAARPRRLLIELDEKVLFNFLGLPAISVSSSELILEGFTQLIFDWQGYVTKEPHIRIYSSGKVKFIPLSSKGVSAS